MHALVTSNKSCGSSGLQGYLKLRYFDDGKIRKYLSITLFLRALSSSQLNRFHLCEVNNLLRSRNV